jgi:hypothetical protein
MFDWVRAVSVAETLAHTPCDIKTPRLIKMAGTGRYVGQLGLVIGRDVNTPSEDTHQGLRAQLQVAQFDLPCKG